ncbi:MAG TPA: flavodoxin, partial [Ruminococcaceae bacterium]|nr:flavodoxin [Oscillospiraceae bacterium]
MEITKDIKNIGVNDYDIDLFEGQYILEKGMAYNSYVILDEKVAVMDTVDKIAVERWLANLDKALNGRTVDYLVVQHLEPDHSAGIDVLAEKYPDMKIICSSAALRMIPNFCDTPVERFEGVKENDTLSLGEHTLTFVMAPMVHWPEVM